MEVQEAIRKRRSIRKYKDKPVPDEVIDELIEAARLAPSGNNIQPWRFYVVKNKEAFVKNKVFHQDFVYKAPLIIVCCSDPQGFAELYKVSKDLDERDPVLRAWRDLSLACENLVLRATELGLGTCYVGWIKRERIKEILDIPERYVLAYVIAMGYPDEEPKPREKKSKEEIVLKEF
ncbi:MAG: nitroreductase family protein [archaeon]|nr:MAG: nitroreductase family protein [archaeon]